MRLAWLGGTGWGLAHGTGSTGPRGDFQQAGDWPVNLQSLNLTTHWENCRRAPRKTAPKRDHLQGRLLNSLSNTEKGWCKDNVVFATQQRFSTGFQDFVCKFMLNPTGRRMPLMLQSLFIHSLQPPQKSCGKLTNRKIAQRFPCSRQKRN